VADVLVKRPSAEIGWTIISSIASIGVRRISSIGVGRISSIGIWISIVSTSIGATIDPANVPTVGSIVLSISL